MIDLLRRGAHRDTQVTVWLVLITATILTAVLGLEQATSGTAAVGVVLLGIAFVKMRLVGIHFMELGNAPLVLRVLFEAYVAVTFMVLLGLFVMA